MMKLKEAQKIVAAIVQWQMILQGVVERDDLKVEVTLSKYSLIQLIQANKLVKAHNHRKRSIHQYWQKKNGKSKSISQQITLADRLIAATYTALNFEASREMHVLINDVGVACVNVNYEDDEPTP